MRAGGGTNTSEALSLGYIELQKAHNRDLLVNGVDNTLNTIVLFTDGVPSAMSAYLNKQGSTSIKNTSPCDYKSADPSVTNQQMKGYLVVAGTAASPWKPQGWVGNPYGPMNLINNDTSSSLATWESGTGANHSRRMKPESAVSDCTYLGEQLASGANCSSSQCRLSSDLYRLPPLDLYGNGTNGLAYASSLLEYKPPYSPHAPNTAPADFNDTSDAYSFAAAAWNATDSIGQTIRNQNFMNQVQIFVILYTGNGGADTGLANRLANTPGSTSYNAAQPSGKVYVVHDTTELTQAFNAVASSILRLAQ
jgi:hypothetical protein